MKNYSIFSLLLCISIANIGILGLCISVANIGILGLCISVANIGILAGFPGLPSGPDLPLGPRAPWNTLVFYPIVCFQWSCLIDMRQNERMQQNQIKSKNSQTSLDHLCFLDAHFGYFSPFFRKINKHTVCLWVSQRAVCPVVSLYYRSLGSWLIAGWLWVLGIGLVFLSSYLHSL